MSAYDKMPTEREIIAKARLTGYTLTREGKINGWNTYRIINCPEVAQQNRYALWNCWQIARDLLNIPV